MNVDWEQKIFQKSELGMLHKIILAFVTGEELGTKDEIILCNMPDTT